MRHLTFSGAGTGFPGALGCAILLAFGGGCAGSPRPGKAGIGGTVESGEGGQTGTTGGALGGGGATDRGGRTGTTGIGNGTGGNTGGIMATGGATGGKVSAGGTNGGVAGRSGRGGAGTGGTSRGSGGARTGGTLGSGGSAGTGTGGGGASTVTGACGAAPANRHPFGCKFAWGIADPGGSLASYSYLQFVSYWVDSSISASGTYSRCNACNWLQSNVAPTNLIPAYYAYIIGFLAHANGIVDGNQSGSKKLTTDGAALVKSKYQAIIDAYAWYAKETAKVWPSKPLVWLLEGDFVQFTDKGQSSPMTYTEIGKLASDIACAIKVNMPNAVVAINHSSWNANEVTQSYWGAMKDVDYDLVWTTGVGNNQGFIAAGANSGTYNAATATYAYLRNTTGRAILVDTSAGASAAGDSWSTASASDLNARIAEGVIAANITGTAPGGLSGNISKLSNLNAIPACP